MRYGTKGLPVLGIENRGTLPAIETMTTVIAVLVSVFAMLLLGRRMRGDAARVAAAAAEVRALHGYFVALLAGSRQSSVAVTATLAARLGTLEPRADAVMLFVPDAGELRCSFVAGRRAEYFHALRLRADDLHALPAAAAARGCRAEAHVPDELLIPTDRSGLAVPLHHADRTLGVIYVSSASGRLRGTDALVAAVELAAHPYALACERESDRAEATYDGLTGALSPRAFRRMLQQWVASTRGDRPRVISLWFVDTDHFKGVNDAFGHAAGDAVLRGMTALLRRYAGAGEAAVARNGGDEFCVMLPGVAKSDAIERARALCRGVREHRFGVPVPITVSVGVAAFPHDAATSSALLEAADAAMYHSKRAGRDRVAFVLAGDRCQCCDE